LGSNQTGPKKKVSNQTDLPRFTYRVRGSASEPVEADPLNPSLAPQKSSTRSDKERPRARTAALT
jgi:hypothetical protein